MPTPSPDLPTGEGNDLFFAHIKARAEAAPPQPASGAHNGGKILTMNDCITVPSGTEVGARLMLGLINSSSYFLPQSKVYVGGLGTGVTLELGDTNDTDGMLAAFDASADDEVELGANAIGKPLWELLGYAEDPLKDLEVFFTVNGQTTGTAADVSYSFFQVNR